jgi:hypothetical protein
VIGCQGWTRASFEIVGVNLFQKEEEEFSFGRGEEMTMFSLKIMVQLVPCGLKGFVCSCI